MGVTPELLTNFNPEDHVLEVGDYGMSLQCPLPNNGVGLYIDARAPKFVADPRAYETFPEWCMPSASEDPIGYVDCQSGVNLRSSAYLFRYQGQPMRFLADPHNGWQYNGLRPWAHPQRFTGVTTAYDSAKLDLNCDTADLELFANKYSGGSTSNWMLAYGSCPVYRRDSSTTSGRANQVITVSEYDSNYGGAFSTRTLPYTFTENRYIVLGNSCVITQLFEISSQSWFSTQLSSSNNGKSILMNWLVPTMVGNQFHPNYSARYIAGLNIIATSAGDVPFKLQYGMDATHNPIYLKTPSLYDTACHIKLPTVQDNITLSVAPAEYPAPSTPTHVEHMYIAITFVDYFRQKPIKKVNSDISTALAPKHAQLMQAVDNGTAYSSAKYYVGTEAAHVSSDSSVAGVTQYNTTLDDTALVTFNTNAACVSSGVDVTPVAQPSEVHPGLETELNFYDTEHLPNSIGLGFNYDCRGGVFLPCGLPVEFENITYDGWTISPNLCNCRNTAQTHEMVGDTRILRGPKGTSTLSSDTFVMHTHYPFMSATNSENAAQGRKTLAHEVSALPAPFGYANSTSYLDIPYTQGWALTTLRDSTYGDHKNIQDDRLSVPTYADTTLRPRNLHLYETAYQPNDVTNIGEDLNPWGAAITT